MKQVLITGGFGYTGGRLAVRLSAKHKLLLSTRSLRTPAALEAHGPIEQLLHANLFSGEWFPRHTDTVIHLAALNEIDCMQFPSEAIRVNIDETRMIAERAAAAGVQHFIYFSTAHVYGSPLAGTITETTLTQPAHPYAITHKAAEDYVLMNGRKTGMATTVIRLSNSFGAPVLPAVNRWSLLVNDLCRQAVVTGKLVLHSNGCQYRDFICLSDMTAALDLVVNDPTSFEGIYNLGSGNSMTVLQMAEQIAAACKTVFQKNIHIEMPAGAVPTAEPALNFSIEKISSRGVRISNKVAEELEQMLHFCQKHFTEIHD